MYANTHIEMGGIITNYKINNMNGITDQDNIIFSITNMNNETKNKKLYLITNMNSKSTNDKFSYKITNMNGCTGHATS